MMSLYGPIIALSFVVVLGVVLYYIYLKYVFGDYQEFLSEANRRDANPTGEEDLEDDL